MRFGNMVNSLIMPAMIKSISNNANQHETKISIVLPVYNQALNISTVISKVFESMQSQYELIIIDDGSRDTTLHELLKIDPSFVRFPNLKSFTIFQNKFSRFETFCDTFGMDNSSGEYFLEIQADMFINDPGFDLRLIEAFEADRNIVAISGRGVENLEPIIIDYKQVLGTDRARTPNFKRYFVERFIYQAKRLLKKIIKFDNSKHLVSGNLESNQYFVEKEDKEFLASGLAGRLGQFVDFKTDHTSFSRKLYVGQTIMRGPILFNREKYFELGGLDSLRFFQGFDDHDFCARALLLGYKVAYTPVDYESPLDIGSTRRSRTFMTELLIAFYTLRIRKVRHSSALSGQAIKDLIHDHDFSEIKHF